MHHMRSDLPGPNKSAVLPGKLSDLASVLWGIYLGLWLFCVGGLWWAGLDLFAAICESFSIVSTGGYGLHTGNLGYYQKPAVYAVSAFFMIVSSLNFGLHYQVVYGGGWSVYFRDSEARTYLTCMFFLLLSILGLLWWGMPSFFEVGEVVFTTVSLMTSSGQQITHHLGWPVWLVFSWIILGVIGGTSGSTAGGIKWARVQFFFQELTNSLAILHHPRAVLPKGTGVEQLHGPASVNQVLLRSFLFAFLIFFLLGLVLCLWLGLDFATAFSSVSACISNTGVGFFGVQSGFSSLSVGVKWVMLFLMLVGRIELLALMVVLSPSYWRTQ